ncbi:MAG: Asp-tRNA(Asn)/Glu-tRNA(Gln) amidotransferase subunit GatA [Candidatus Spechtbacterales bacterium]
MSSNLTLKEIKNNIQKGDTAPSELASFYLARIKDRDGEIHSYLHVAEDAQDKAQKADIKAGGEYGPLFGIPYAVKDNILVKDMPCTAASKILENHTAVYNASVIEKLSDEGAIVLGKTNMDEFAMGSSTENSAFGATKNPHDTSRVPGGSSGGSAAAVAAGLAPFALGSDTGGSIRQPAAFCGVVGFKPTYGAVSRYGLIAMASSLDQIGPITNTVEDAKTVFNFILGKDEMDSTSMDLGEYGREKSPKDLKIGIPEEYFGDGLDPKVKKRVLEAVEVYRKMGAQVKEISMPHALYSLAVYYIIMPSEASSNLARYDGVKYGLHVADYETQDLLDMYLKVRGQGFGPEALRRVMLGTYILSAGYYDAYYIKAQKVRNLIEEDFTRAFEDVDVIISPTTPTPAFKSGEKTQDPLQMYLSDIYTVSANLAGLPCVSVPVGEVEESGSKLPAGMQIFAPRKKDHFLLDVAEWYEKEVNGVK